MMSSITTTGCSKSTTPSPSSEIFIRHRITSQSAIQRSNLALPLSPSKSHLFSTSSKPLSVSPALVRSFGILLEDRNRRYVEPCRAYEAEGGEGDQAAAAAAIKSEAAKKAKIGVYFATWWALNVVFNIYNKKVLNAFPYPWLTSTLSLAAGSLIMIISWATKLAEPPNTDFDFWKTLLPVYKDNGKETELKKDDFGIDWILQKTSLRLQIK